MVAYTIENIFDFISETNITEKYFYKFKGVYPVFSGQTENNGIVAYIDSYKQDMPCITFNSYGNAGKLFYRKGKYTIGRNCIGLVLKQQFKNKINLEWFSYKYQNLFYKHRIGDLKGQKSLNKTLIKNVIINIPNIQTQNKQLKTYQKTKNLLNKIKTLISKLNDLLKSKLENLDYIYNEKIGEIFNIKGGNSGLTEKFIYYNQPTNEDEKIQVFSGATVKSNLMGYISKNARPKGRKLKIFYMPAILVVRKGIAGKMTYIEKEEFTTNDDTYVLTHQKEWKNKINLRWFVYQYQELFYNIITSKSDNATFNKQYAEKQIIKIPDIEFQNKFANKLIKIDNMIEKLENLKDKIENLIEYEII